MNVIDQLLSNKVLLAALLSWAIAQLIKVFTVLYEEHRFDLSKMMASGGMPSSHTSFVVALTIGVGQTSGYDSILFAIAAVFSCIVMYDAANVRLEAGKQAAVLNQLVDVIQDPNLNVEERLKEILGHTPIQVAAGAILGIVVALAFFVW